MNNQKIALLAIPIFAAIMIGATVVPAHAGDTITQLVDIKPGSDPNSINVFNNGVIPVAILSSATFDATAVDVGSLAFGPDGAAPIHRNGHMEDVDGDGLTDFVSHYRTQETGIAFGDVFACITGATEDGSGLFGCDDISTVPMT